MGKMGKNNARIRKSKNYQVNFNHEKGVDVLIAVDLLVGAYENKQDTAILVTSDTDFIPAIKKVRTMKKKIEYIGFSHKPSYALIANSNIRRLLIKDEILEYFKEE